MESTGQLTPCLIVAEVPDWLAAGSAYFDG